MMNSSPAIERLGIPAFDWWSEALHGVGRNGLATVFPSCIGMAASFDDDMIDRVFTAVSDEARAKNTEARRRGQIGKYKCLSFWTPTVNIFRDPSLGPRSGELRRGSIYERAHGHACGACATGRHLPEVYQTACLRKTFRSTQRP